MTFLEEIAQRIDKALDGDCGYGVGKHLAEQLSPLIAEHDAALIEGLAALRANREPSEAEVEAFRAAWCQADAEWDGAGSRVRRGLLAAQEVRNGA